MANIVFENANIQALYNKTHSYEFAKLETVHDMRDYLLPYVKAVIEDSAAYSEGVNKWDIFSKVTEQLQTKDPVFKIKDLETSICVSLWFYVYH